MPDGLAALDAQIARVEGLRELGRAAAPDVARAVEALERRQIAAGVDPYGKPWARREDGGVPLANAAEALTVVAVGARVVLRLRGHIARHHRGFARGGIVRQVIPSKGAIPAPMQLVIRRVLTEHFEGAMRG